jgi:glycosyltransferase involved in cell wall biosynthesis
MGCWKPVIATPVGENTRVVEHGINGFLADTPQQWFDALELLFSDPKLCQTMGARGRVKVEAEYSLAVTAPRLVEILKRGAGEVDYKCVE